MNIQQQAFNDKLLKKIADVREYYQNNPKKDSFNLLLYGDFGTGKTAIARTCKFPVLIHSFDAGGTKTSLLQPYIEDGNILVDDSFEGDRWKDPKAYRAWEREVSYLKQIGMFDHIGTYILDSATRWADCMMYEIIKMRRTGKSNSPFKDSYDCQIQDYGVQQITGVDALDDIMSLPCDVIVTGHIGIDKDEVSGALTTGILLAGKFSAKVPLVFDEKYIACVKSGGANSKPVHLLQTHTVGIYKAETRIGGDKFDVYEEPDIKKLLRKAGRSVKDKPSFKEILGTKQDMPKP